MMKGHLKYKDFIAELSFDFDDMIIVGNVINTADIISFHSESMQEIEQIFHDVVDTYLEECEKEGINPSKTYSGKFNLRIDPALHKQLSEVAVLNHKSLNQLAEETIVNGLKHL